MKSLRLVWGVLGVRCLRLPLQRAKNVFRDTPLFFIYSVFLIAPNQLSSCCIWRNFTLRSYLLGIFSLGPYSILTIVTFSRGETVTPADFPLGGGCLGVFWGVSLSNWIMPKFVWVGLFVFPRFGNGALCRAGLRGRLDLALLVMKLLCSPVQLSLGKPVKKTTWALFLFVLGLQPAGRR